MSNSNVYVHKSEKRAGEEVKAVSIAVYGSDVIIDSALPELGESHILSNENKLAHNRNKNSNVSIKEVSQHDSLTKNNKNIEYITVNDKYSFLNKLVVAGVLIISILSAMFALLQSSTS